MVRVVAVVSQQRERTQEKLAQQMSIQTEELRAVLSPPRCIKQDPLAPFPAPCSSVRAQGARGWTRRTAAPSARALSARTAGRG